MGSVRQKLFDRMDDDYTRNMLDDLQLAAELGKTLLERNKELENSLKQHQNVIEDQTQEIEYLTKQTVALREVNDSRLRIYEQLEVSIQDLERANHRLAIENASEKKQIKTLTNTVDNLEAKCEELHNNIEDLNLQLDGYKRRVQRPMAVDTRHPESPDVKANFVRTPEQSPNVNRDQSEDGPNSILNITVQKDTDIILLQDDNVFDEEDIATGQIAQLVSQLQELRAQRVREQRRVTELEEQMATMVQENRILENQLVNIHQREDELSTKSIHEEINTLDEVRQGQLCSRCLRNVDTRSRDDNMSLIMDPEDDDDDSMMDALMDRQYRSSVSMEIQDPAKLLSPPRETGNLYRDLVEKYEALLEVHRHPSTTSRAHKAAGGNSLSLQEEMQMSGDFTNLHTKDTDEESGLDSFRGSSTSEKPIKNDRKTFSQTPTDFSEAETSSSGFSDETSNKATQTEGRPGSFLCTIADGEDCRFSIYDDASPIDSRFRNRPEYRELFKEIFTVLKKAAENKDEGEQLPLLDDIKQTAGAPRVPPVTPATEECPGDFTDDTQSVLSSTMSEMSTGPTERPTLNENLVATPPPVRHHHHKEVKHHGKEAVTVTTNAKNDRVLTPLVRQPLEYLQVAVNVRKRSSSRKNHKKQYVDRSDSPILPTMGSPKVAFTNRLGNNNSGRRRGEQRGNGPPTQEYWNGTTMQFWSNTRNVASPTPSQGSQKSVWDIKPSTASQDLHKLKRLDLSYAEVLRNADTKKREVFHKSGRRK